MKKTSLLLTLAVLAITLAGCGQATETPPAEAPETSEAPITTPPIETTPPVEATETETPEPTPLQEPANAAAPMPEAVAGLSLAPGELLFTAEVDFAEAEQSLFAFVLSADGKSVTNLVYNIYNGQVTNIIDGQPADTYISPNISTTGDQTVYEVVNDSLTISSSSIDLSLAIDGETATGTIAFHQQTEGFSMDALAGMMIEGMEYPDDIPPSESNFSEVPVVFEVAKRG